MSFWIFCGSRASPPAPRGVPRIEVTFKLTPDRILEARAEDIATGAEHKITVQATDRRLTEDEKTRMIGEARQRVQKGGGHQGGGARDNSELDELCGRAEALAKTAPHHSRAADLKSAAADARRLAKSGADGETIDDKLDQLSRMITEVEADV
jgi:molecular chaperone DnaK